MHAKLIFLYYFYPQMGMKRMFGSGAQFDELLEQSDPLYVSKVVHKAFIEVNEEGAEAAAATGKLYPTVSSSCSTHCFLFYVFYLTLI